MDRKIRFLEKNKIYIFLFGFTLLIGIPPLVKYAYERLTGSLPSYEEWVRHGGNHGPWHFLPEADMVVNSSFALVVLAEVTLLVSVIISLRSKGERVTNLSKGIAIVTVQLLWAFMILWTTFWAID